MTRVVSSRRRRGARLELAQVESGAGAVGVGDPGLGTLARAAQLAEGDRVAAGLGGEVAAEAEHVRPLAEQPVRRRAGVLVDGASALAGEVRGAVALAAGAGARCPWPSVSVGGLGGVLGQVAGDLLRGQGPVGVVGAAGGADRPGVDLGAERQDRAGRRRRTGAAVNRTAAAACSTRRPGRGGGRAGRGGGEPVGACWGPSRRTRAWKWIGAAPLVLGDLGVLHRRRRPPSRLAGCRGCWASTRRRVMVNRRHSSGAHHCHTTCEA